MMKNHMLSAAAALIMAASPALAGEFTTADGHTGGMVTMKGLKDGTVIQVEAVGLAPGWHGIHIHAKGDCSDYKAGFKKAGPHFMHNKDEKHGLSHEAHHMGDLPNIWGGEDGGAGAEFLLPHVKPEELADKDGSALMIHAKPDDHMTDPSGNSGDRVACAIIAPPAEQSH